MKLRASEAERLLSFMRRTCRPRTPDEVAEFDHWAKLLIGPKS